MKPGREHLKLWREQDGGRDGGEGQSASVGRKVILGFPAALVLKNLPPVQEI